MEQLRQQRRAGDGVHPELQRTAPAASSSIPTRREFGGTFGVGIGAGGDAQQRLLRPSQRGRLAPLRARARPDRSRRRREITPYVDGQPVSYQKESSGTGAGPFASSTLYLFSRGGNSLFGSGSLDELAIYSGELSAARDPGTLQLQRPRAAPGRLAHDLPEPRADRPDGHASTRSGSHYANGSIVKYEWDLDGNGTYETSTGTTPTSTTSFATPRHVQRRPAGHRQRRRLGLHDRADLRSATSRRSPTSRQRRTRRSRVRP